MSAAAGSANKANLYSEEIEALYDPYSLFTVSSYFTEIPWPEWNDADLNIEAWDEGKGRAATAAGGKKDVVFPSALFDDSDPPSLPLFIKHSVCSWKRPQEVFQNVTLTVYEPTNSEFELILPSPAADCDFFKSFNEQLPILQYYASKYGFPVELETPKYVANTQGETWRPWHHIYALCKAGKGQVHKPLYCPYGKYVVRIFYMGCWRKFVVDDKIPCDEDGKCMLPTTQILGELWPIILAKALLKIISLTPTYDLFVTDFPMLSFFTGWMQGTFSGVNKTCDQIWRRLSVLLPCYELPDEATELETKSVAYSSKNLASKKESRPGTEKRDSQNEKFCFLLAAMEGFSSKENLYDDYTIGVTMIRDRPLAKMNKREGTKPWKRIRWVYWAKEKGLWTDEELMPPYRRVLTITFVKEIVEFLAPDPKQESTLYDIVTDNEDSEEELFGENSYFEPEQWCDFLKFKQHLSRIYVFFKPSLLKSNYKITCLKERIPETAGSGKSAGKVLPPQNFFSYPPTLKQTCNEPLFLFCESSTGVFLGISFSVSPKKAKSSFYYLQGDQPDILRIVHGTLIIEKFLWDVSEQGEIIGMVETVGNSSLLLSLNPGRHILKLWLSCDSPYVIDVYSNVGVIVNKHSRIRHMMKSESERILNYIANVSNAFIALTLKFGKPDLPSALRDFYNAIKPGNDGMIDYRRKIDDFIETFLNCILLSLKNLISNTDELKIMMWALQSLFFNPNIHCDLPSGDPPASIYGAVKKQQPVKKVISVTKERTLSEILDHPWTYQQICQIVLIQRVFRGFRIRLLWKYQTPARKEFKPYVERLKKICDTLFVPPKREQEVGMLLRRILITNPDLLTTFRFYKDFYNVIQVDDYTGKIANVEPFAWVPITRFVVACHSENLVPCTFYLSCNLQNFIIQGFDNDTNKEIFRLTNNVSPHYYQNNVRGYTIFAFGWNEANTKTVNWKLEVVRVKYFQAVHPCNLLVDFTCRPYPMPNLEVLEMRNFYIPNSKNRVCRCFIKIQKRTLLTLRFSASYTGAQFILTIFLDKNFCASGSETNNTDRVITKLNSTNGAVMVSSLILEFVESPWWGESYPDSESTVYIVEVSVLNNSWPLTKQEWGVVEPLRVNGESWKDSAASLQSKKGGSDSRKRLTRMAKRGSSEQKTIENPFWLIQVLNDSVGPDTGDSMTIEEDKSFAESIKAMKVAWEEKDPGRRKRGREIRMKFLCMILMEERKNDWGEGEGSFGEYDKDSEKGCEVVQNLIERMSSFSYLTNDTSPTRYVNSPRTLPATPMFQLLCKYYKLNPPAADNSEEWEFCCEMSENTQKSSKAFFVELDEDMREFLNQCVHYRSILLNHTNEEQKLSNQLMEEAYEGRLKAIERMMR